MAERAFSTKCGHCRQRAVERAVVPYSVQIDHDGQKYQVSLPELTVLRCNNCGTISLDEEANRAISAAFRQQVGLLSPEQIQEKRKALGLTEQALADALGVSGPMLARWETGAQFQSRALDRFLRAFFGLPELRRLLLGGALSAPAGNGLPSGEPSLATSPAPER